MNKDLNTSERIIESIVPVEAENVRLDLYLANRFTYNSRTAWQEIISSGGILLCGRKTRPSRQLHAGEKITFIVPEIEEPAVSKDYKIIHDCREYVVVSKPGNLPVHPSGCYFANTLLMLMKKDWGKLYIVNRLDRETSGITVFAKSSLYAGILAGLFQERATRKRYTALVHGEFAHQTLEAEGFLSRDTFSEVRKKRRFTFDLPEGVSDYEDCKTTFTLSEVRGAFSFIDCLLHTGRLHQIRATLFSLGYPLVGDKLYGLDDTIYIRQSEGRMTFEDSQKLMIPRQALHAASLEFVSPFDGKKCFYESEIPYEIKNAVI